MFMLDPEKHPAIPNPNRLRSVVAVERDGFDVRTLAMVFRILSDDPGFNLAKAVKEASTQYVLTEDGRKVYNYNCSHFNWADFFSNVPNDVCRQHGFEKVDSVYAEEDVEWDECLVDDSVIGDDEEEE